MFQILSLPYIRRWLRSLDKRGAKWGGKMMREGPTINSIATYTGISRNTLTWVSRKDTANLGPDLVRKLSKVIAEIENGVLDFKIQGNRKVAVRYDKPEDRPRVRQKYQVSIGGKGPSITATDRPRLPGKMPTLKDLMGG
jgi:hypothetical protein